MPQGLLLGVKYSNENVRPYLPSVPLLEALELPISIERTTLGPHEIYV